MSDSELSFFGVEFFKYYGDQVHGYLSVFVCSFGSIANVLNMIVFTRKHMISPINTILWFLALVDLILLLVYLPEVWYNHFRPNSNPCEYLFYTYEWALFMQWRFHIGEISRNTSVWLTALVSFWRYIAIVYPLKNRIWCNMGNILKTVALVFLLCVLLQVPAFFIIIVFPITEYDFTAYALGYNTSDPLLRYLEYVNYFLYGVFCVLLPAFFMTALSAKLFLAFSKIKKSREHLNAEGNSNAAYTRNEKQMTRTTLILVILSVVCLITFLPQTILGLSYFFLEERVHYEFMDILLGFTVIPVLINSAISFFIYYAIGEQFRETFKALFKVKSTQEASIRKRQNRISSNDCVI